MMLRLRPVLTSLATLALLATIGTGAHAQIAMSANLTHDQEPPPGGTTAPTNDDGSPRPLSFGTANFFLNAAQTQLTMTVTVFNIDITGTQTGIVGTGDIFDNDNLVAAHIHVGAPPGVNAPVRWGFFGAPDNDTSPKQMVITPFVGGVGGTFTSVWDQPEGNAGTTLTSNLPQILAGLSYINFHTTQFGGGEIRGQIIAAPEPGTVALLALGGLPLAGALLRRRAK